MPRLFIQDIRTQYSCPFNWYRRSQKRGCSRYVCQEGWQAFIHPIIFDNFNSVMQIRRQLLNISMQTNEKALKKRLKSSEKQFREQKCEYQGVIDLSLNTHLSAPSSNEASPTTPVPQPKSKQVPRDDFEIEDVEDGHDETSMSLLLRLTR